MIRLFFSELIQRIDALAMDDPRRRRRSAGFDADGALDGASGGSAT